MTIRISAVANSLLIAVPACLSLTVCAVRPAIALEGLTSHEVIELTAEERAWLAGHPNITLGGGGIPGSDYTDQETGEIIGVGPDYLRVISELLGVQFKHVSHSWDKAHDLAKTGEIDGIRLLLRTKEREQYLSFSEPYVSMQHSVFQRKGSDQVRTVEELVSRKLKVGVLHRSYAETYLKNNYPDLDVVPYPIITDALSALGKHSVEAVIATDTSAAQAMNDTMLASVEPVTNISGMSQGLHIGVRKDWPELIPILNKAIKAIPRETHTAIRSKWIGTSRSNKFAIELTDEERSWLAQNHTVHVRLTDFPPFQSVGKEGPIGISVDYLKLIADRTGVKIAFTPETTPFEEAIKEMINLRGPDLIQCVVRTPKREANVSFTKDYFSSPRVIYVSSDSEHIQGIEDLSGKSIAVPRGTLVHEQLAKQFPMVTIELFDTDKEALEAVAFDKADAYIGNLTLGAFLILEHGLTNLKVAAPAPLGDHVFSYGCRKDWPELSSIINKGLDTITPAERARIRNQYISIRYENLETAVIVKWVLMIGGAASAIVFLFFFWNKSLKRQVKERTSELQDTNESLSSEITERKQAEKEILQYQGRLKALVKELTVTEERERRRLAADLHDDVGQTLALAGIQLASARKSVTAPEHTHKLDELSASILKATRDTRHLIYDLSSPSLNELGLDEAIAEWLDEEIGNRYGLETRVIGNFKQPQTMNKDSIDDDLKALVFRSVRELLINVVKHAEARSVVVQSEHTDGQIRISVEDDGVGFDPDANAFRASPQGGFGLFSIRERMVQLGGTLQVESAPGKGCCVRLSTPCERSDDTTMQPKG